MKNIANNQNLSISGTWITQDRVNVTSLTSKIATWDLNQLQGLTTYECVKDDAARKKAAHALKLRNNMLTGAIAGGLFDASSGEDSVLDGVIYGAMFGAISTGSPDEGVGKVGLVFWDGSYLALEVNSAEFTLLQTIAESNSLKTSPAPAPACIKRSLSRKEMEDILRDRALSDLYYSIITAVFLLVGANTVPSLFNDSIALAKFGLSPDTLSTLMLFPSVLTAAVMLVKGFLKQLNLDNYFRSAAEKEAFKQADLLTNSHGSQQLIR
ncbi:hypothetical protein [Motilimonas eburnea]|uniref:hypothetical protein n=1 Tax=Motilimonas eburnea TaxID=1737488 RepID=UPI001E3925A1|nr:hypothetical protein [Motilimonas eburnea]MCE2571845.1 hypothetical protein [Motilimonas eburnea]